MLNVRTLLTTTAILATVFPAIANAASGTPRTLARSGEWEAYYTVNEGGRQMCGMSIGNLNNGPAFYVKYVVGSPMWMSIAKTTWRIPKGTKIPAYIQFDKSRFNIEGFGNTVTKPEYAFGSIDFTIPDERLKDFLSQFEDADKMWIGFKSGTQGPVYANMTGSREVSIVFKKCVLSITNTPQPFDAQPAPSAPQPFDGNAAPPPPEPTSPPASAPGNGV